MGDPRPSSEELLEEEELDKSPGTPAITVVRESEQCRIDTDQKEERTKPCKALTGVVRKSSTEGRPDVSKRTSYPTLPTIHSSVAFCYFFSRLDGLSPRRSRSSRGGRGGMIHRLLQGHGGQPFLRENLLQEWDRSTDVCQTIHPAGDIFSGQSLKRGLKKDKEEGETLAMIALK